MDDSMMTIAYRTSTVQSAKKLITMYGVQPLQQLLPGAAF